MNSSERVFLIVLFLIHLGIITKLIPMIMRLETKIRRLVISLVIKRQFGKFSSFYLVIGFRFQNRIPSHTQVLPF